MNEGRLREILREAHEKGQEGLFIWHNEETWDTFNETTFSGDKSYDYAIKKLKRQKETTHSMEIFGIVVPLFISIPVKKMINDNNFFNSVLDVCKENGSVGPVTLIPSNELSEIYP